MGNDVLNAWYTVWFSAAQVATTDVCPAQVAATNLLPNGVAATWLTD